MAGLVATVLNIQRMSTEDGPGIRSTVFLKGCSLECVWCQNPESISPKTQVIWNDFRCINCGACIEACEQSAISAGPEGIERDGRCLYCGACADVCPTGAMEILGAPWAVEDLLAEVLKDRAYYERAGGGVTVSGGEPALQADFVEAFLARCREEGLHTAVDTCGQCSEGAMRKLLRHAELVLYDLKALDEDLHTRLTGHSSARILNNLALVAEQDLKLWIRTPLVPGDTDTDENIEAIAKHLATRYAGRVNRWELLAFNHLCEDKYRRLGLPWRYAGAKPQTAERLEAIRALAIAAGLDAEQVRVTGAARREAR
ncbi:MAG: glycyl-radical enzyme activating protein [Deltaproteobacteria bacterium]|nr:glycyl-radical enzyme activating protein [Deltaproteobacteria bacterium]